VRSAASVSGFRRRRPLTHQLAFETIRALESELKHVDIVDLRDNTFFAQLVLQQEGECDDRGRSMPRPSDAVALALASELPDPRGPIGPRHWCARIRPGPTRCPNRGETPGETDKPDEDEGSDEGGSKADPVPSFLDRRSTRA